MYIYEHVYELFQTGRWSRAQACLILNPRCPRTLVGASWATSGAPHGLGGVCMSTFLSWTMFANFAIEWLNMQFPLIFCIENT